MSKDALRRGYLRGYEDGLHDAWKEVVRITSRGLSPTELALFAKSKLAVLYREVEARALRLAKEPVEESREVVRVEAFGGYLVREERAEDMFELFADLVGKGYRGLCVARRHPDDVARRFGLREVRFLWLTRTDAGKKRGRVAYVSPTDLVKLAGSVVRFLDAGGAVVAMEGLEYLIAQNGFPPVLRLVQSLVEKVTLKGSFLLVSANPEAMERREFGLIAKEMVETV
jgi:hypothetical protein